MKLSFNNKRAAGGARVLKKKRRLEIEKYIPISLRRRKLSRRELLTLLIPAVAAVAAVVIVIAMLDRGTSYKLSASAYQYYAGSTAKVEVGAELRRRNDGVSLLIQGDHSAETTLPIYLSDSPRVVLPTDMIYVLPRSIDYKRLVYFSEVECKTNGAVVVARENGSVNPEPGFLYDGKDFYLFLEPMTLEFNGYTMDVPALSYVEAVYGGYMMVFNYETKEFFMEMSDGTGTARTPYDDYTISLLGDSMTLYDGTRLLLATRADLFDPLV